MLPPGTLLGKQTRGFQRPEADRTRLVVRYVAFREANPVAFLVDPTSRLVQIPVLSQRDVVMSVSKQTSIGTEILAPGPSSTTHHDFDAESHGALSESLTRPAPLETVRGLWSKLKSDVDTRSVSAPLAAYCFMTGFLYVLAFVFRTSYETLLKTQ